MKNMEKYIAFGVFDGQLYGPYTKEGIEAREQSGSSYADKLEYFQDGEDEYAAEDRLRKKYGIED